MRRPTSAPALRTDAIVTSAEALSAQRSGDCSAATRSISSMRVSFTRGRPVVSPRARSWRSRRTWSRSLSYSRPGRRARPRRQRRPPCASGRGRVYSCALPSLNDKKKSFSSERTRFSAFRVMRSAQGGRQTRPVDQPTGVNGASLHCALRCSMGSNYRVLILDYGSWCGWRRMGGGERFHHVSSDTARPSGAGANYW